MAFLQYKKNISFNIQANRRNLGSSNVISQNREIIDKEVNILGFNLIF